MTRPSIALLGAILAATAGASGATGTRTTPDGRQLLVSKDLGGERWAITLDLTDGSVTGNVFRPGGGPPQFVWCDRLGDDGGDPAATTLQVDCFGAEACTASPCRASAWTRLGEVSLPGAFFLPAEDPFAPLRSEEHFCDPIGHGPERLGGELSWGVETGACNWNTVVQPSRFAVEPGDEVSVRMWHFTLTSRTEGEEAYMAVGLGDRTVWQARLPIPCEAGFVGLPVLGADCLDNPAGVDVDPPVFAAAAAAPAGSPVYFHVHNHGLNGYNLIDVSVNGVPLVGPEEWELVSRGLPLFAPPEG